MEIKDVENLAELARIELSENEKKELLSDMGSILKYVEQIQSVDVGNIDIKDEVCNVWREDGLNVREFSSELIVQQFPDAQGGFLKVKKILP